MFHGLVVSLRDCSSHKQIGSTIQHITSTKCVALSSSGGHLACGFSKNITIRKLRDVLPSEYFGYDLPLVQRRSRALQVLATTCEWERELGDRALIRAHLKLAIEDGKESLQVQLSPIGYIAMAIVLLGQGDRESALLVFDLAFHDCESRNNRFLLLLRSILVFESENPEDAITFVELLATRANDDNDDDTAYICTQAGALRGTELEM